LVAENSSGYQLAFPREASLFFFWASDGVLGLAIFCRGPPYDLKNIRWGLWENWKDPASGEWIRTFAIITTEANELVAEIHDGMPLILAPGDYVRWLSKALVTHMRSLRTRFSLSNFYVAVRMLLSEPEVHFQPLRQSPDVPTLLFHRFGPDIRLGERHRRGRSS